MTMRKNRIILTFTILLLCFSFVSTPITALATNGAKEAEKENLTQTDESRTDTQKEPPITTNGEEFYIEEETPTEEWFGEESASNSSTRGNDEIVNTTDLEDGVYAFQNSGSTNLWMDLEQNNYYSTAHIQQCRYSTPPTELFERAALFKVTRVGTTNRYIIRLMMNNLLSFEFVGNSVMTKRIPANDADVSISDTFVISYSSSGYSIKPYSSSYDEYICAQDTTSSGMADAPASFLVKNSLNNAGNCGRWIAHKYTGTARSGYSANTTVSLTNGITVGTVSTLTMYSWSTMVGHNKPNIQVVQGYITRATVNEITSMSHFAGKYELTARKAGKFELAYEIYSGNTLTNSWGQPYMVIPRLTSNVFCLRNTQTKRYMDLEGPSTAVGAYIQQWSYSGVVQKQWIITPVGGGYYTIQSRYSNLYVGVDSAGSAVRQYNAVNDYSKWYFHEIDDTTATPRYAILSKAWTTVKRAIATPSDSDTLGDNLTTMPFVNNSTRREEWELYPLRYAATLRNVFDAGYSEYYSETTAQSQQWINEYSLGVAERYLQLFGLALNLYSSAESITSPIDVVKAQNNLDYDDMTEYSNRSSLISTYGDQGSATMTYAYWSCHKILTGFSSNNEYNRSFSYNTCICILAQYSKNAPVYRGIYSKALLMHEVNHQYGAIDHYHDVVGGECRNKLYCSICGLFPRDSQCIMNKSDDASISDATILCDACTEEIHSHLTSHHTIPVNNGG